MMKKTQNEILKEIKNTETLTAVEIIISSEDHEIPNRPLGTPVKASIIINDELFSTPYEIEEGYTFDFLKTIKKTIPKEVLLIYFEDADLPKAWADAYTAGGIPEERHDRRVIFHPYNEMCEMYCVDRNLLWDITDYFKGTPHELTKDKCGWRWNIIQWYKKHLI